jgi:hypothetical protein
MHYANPGGRSVVGELVARRAPGGGEFQLEFSSGPGIPLLKLWQSGDTARAEGVFARGKWQGRTTAVPPALKSWVRLAEIFAQMAPGRDDLRGPGWAATVSYAAAQPERCTVTFTETGERFAFQFSR